MMAILKKTAVITLLLMLISGCATSDHNKITTESLLRNGDTLYKSGRYSEAIVSYKEAIKLDPEEAKAHSGLGNAYSKVGKYDEAIEAYEQAMRLILIKSALRNNVIDSGDTHRPSD